MKIVITGGLGFVGKNFALYMRKIGAQHELHSVDWFADAPQADHDLFTSSTIADFASDEAKPVFEGADVVVHLAAATTVQESIQDPYRSFNNNVIKTQALLDHLRDVAPNAHFVFASTGGAIIGEHDGAINESIPARPVSPYGATKLAVEGLLSAYTGSFGMPTAAMRFSNVYGPNSERKTSVVAVFCKNYMQTGRLQINGDGLQTRDYIYIDDICQALWKTIEKRATGPFQLGTGVGTSILELVEILKAVDPAKELEIVHAPDLQGEVKHNVCDITRARTVLGFEPEYDLKRGVDETLAWFKRTL
ncbi:NAD-dependent epimerase/dehydratase family protein [Aliishimia ponticola]|uniref:NAD-dependent epimerase/dehydratase family protein n=1 Tax=Aliishimia ponticola TaxID=2499833 RepID=A0A4S4NES4_9RHOB|nr:NAD-dependent epimerase/dehydratase family protein [Aliishimia ponticola]THH38044.1 NAD-dependent epimerase/dehydratase family protein [Aliishimia ponticola]